MKWQEHAALDALVEQARRAEPPAATPLDARRMARLAVGAAEQSKVVSRRRWAWLCAACVALGLVGLGARELVTRGTTIEVGLNGRPLRVALSSGDALLAAPGTRIQILAQDADQRALRLTAGAALFEVQRLAGARRFEVHTEHADVRVVGTVFSVEVQHGRTIVRVYEGTVLVSQRSLGAGEVWVSSGPPARLEDDRLARDGRAAAAQRARSPSVTVSTLPDVTGVPIVSERDAGSAPAATVVIVAAAPLASPDVMPEEARAWLLAGDSERALLAAQSHAEEHEPAWLLLEADSLRALHRYADSVDRYQNVAERAPALRVSAGYAGASLSLYELHDPTRALALLDALALDAMGSSLRERASVLRVNALLALGRRDEAKTAAQRYLDREPETKVSQRMRALTH